jgi:hypothetical protein
MYSLQTKKIGQIGGLSNTVMGFAMVGITLVVFMLMLGKFANLTDVGGKLADADALAVVDDTKEAGATISSMLPILAIVIIVGYVLASLGIFSNQR